MPADAGFTMTFNKAKQYAQAQNAQKAPDHNDWGVPSRNELNVLFNHRAAIGGFNASDSDPSAWYWSATPTYDWGAWGQRFRDGLHLSLTTGNHLSVAAEALLCLGDLAEVLVDCVEGGAALGFMPPFAKPDAREFFSKVIQEVAAEERILLAAYLRGKLVGTVQVLTAMLPDQLHRAELNKLLVLRSARRHGLGTALLQRAEQCAREEGKTLLVLGTVAGALQKSSTKSWAG
jgi:ribosomal protein S18 acetylase RimI-like enzyme